MHPIKTPHHHGPRDRATEIRLRQKRKEGQVKAFEWSLSALDRLLIRTRDPIAKAALKTFRMYLEKQHAVEVMELDQLDDQERRQALFAR